MILLHKFLRKKITLVLHAIEVTKSEREKGKLQNVAVFFIEALKNKYQKSETIVKQKNIEKKAELAVKTQKEEAQKGRVEDAKRKESARKITIINQLISNDAPIIHRAIADIQNSMFSTSYNGGKPDVCWQFDECFIEN